MLWGYDFFLCGGGGDWRIKISLGWGNGKVLQILFFPLIDFCKFEKVNIFILSQY